MDNTEVIVTEFLGPDDWKAKEIVNYYHDYHKELFPYFADFMLYLESENKDGYFSFSKKRYVYMEELRSHVHKLAGSQYGNLKY